MNKLKTLSMKNFMAFGKTPVEVDLSSGVTWFIYGDNRDIGNPGESKNGAGKTTLFQAITFALYGVGIEKKMKADQFINFFNGKKMEVCLVFEKKGIEYRIVRGRKPNFVEFNYKESNGEWKSLSRDSMANTDKEIARVFDIPYEIFIQTIFMSPHTESFMGMGAADQRNFMESVLSLDVLADRAETLKKVIKKDLEDEVKLLDRDLENAEHNNEKVTANLERLKRQKDSFDTEKLESIDLLVSDLEDIPDYTEEERKEILSVDDLNTEAEEVSNEFSHLEKKRLEAKHELQAAEKHSERYDELVTSIQVFDDKNRQKTTQAREELDSLPTEEEIRKFEHETARCFTLEDEIKDIEKEIKSIETDEKRLERDLEKCIAERDELASGKCPYCSQDHYDAEKVESLEEKAEDFRHILEGKDKEKQEFVDSLDKLGESLNDYINIVEKTLNDNPMLEKEGLLGKRQSLESQIENASTDNPYEQDLEDFVSKHGDSKELAKQIEKRQEAIASIENKIESSSQKISEINSEIKRIKELYGISGKKEFDEIQELIESLTASILKEKQSKNPYEEEIEKTKELLVDVSKVREQKEETDKSLEHVKYLIKLLTDPKSFIRKNIVDQYLPVLNKKIIERTQGLGLPHVAKVNADMTVDIDYMGKSVSYFTMSRGERLRLDTATSFAFRDLMASLGKDCNLLMVDELLDGSSDQSGIMPIFDLIKEYSDDVFIVSHREEFKDAIKNKMIMIKKNGFSDIQYQ